MLTLRLTKTKTITKSNLKFKKTIRNASQVLETESPKENIKPFTDIPNLGKIPLFGAFKALQKINERDYQFVYDHGSKMGRVDLLGAKMLVLHDVKDIKEFLSYEGEFPFGLATLSWPVKHNKEVQEKAGYNTVHSMDLGLEGEKWKEARLFYQKNIFPPKDASTFLPHIDRSAVAITEAAPTFEEDFVEFSRKAAMDLFYGFVFGSPSGLFSNPPNENALAIHDASGRFMTGVVKLSMTQKWQSYLPGKLRNLRLDFEKAIIDKKEVWARIGDEKVKEMMEAKDELRTTSYLPLLAHRYDGDWNKALDDSLEFIAAAIDTTSGSIVWTLYHAASHPEEQELIFEEIDRVLKGEGIHSQETLDSLTYTKAFYQEAGRITPVADGPVRKYDHDVVVNGFNIPAGTLVFAYSSFASSRDETIFESPNEFRPDRWLPEAKKERRKNGKSFPHDSPMTIMPFSVGKRMCLGARIAEREVILLLARLVQKYKISLAPDSPIPDVNKPNQEQGMWYPTPIPSIIFTKRN